MRKKDREIDPQPFLSLLPQFWTQSASPSGKPRLVRISSPRSDRLRVKWEDPDSDSWNGPIVAYKIGWRETSSSSSSSESSSGEGRGGGVSYNWTEVERHDATDLQLVLPALRAYTRYELLIQAVNDVGAGPTEMARARTSGDGKPSLLWVPPLWRLPFPNAGCRTEMDRN